jgi:hypothetical protein
MPRLDHRQPAAVSSHSPVSAELLLGVLLVEVNALRGELQLPLRTVQDFWETMAVMPQSETPPTPSGGALWPN